MQIGPYRVLSELGRGGMGVVYRAHDPALDREVALKVLTNVTSDPAELALRFRREAQAMARLRHPNIVGVHSVGTTPQGLPYLVMDLVEGESLAARIARDGPLPEAEAVRSFEALARALEHAHARGVLHRDLKPHNVLSDRDGLVLTDFGLAALVSAETRLTRSGDTMGTPAYMAPEQARADRGRLGPATDVHGLGATLFHALTGEPPFRGAAPLEVLEAVLRDEAPDPRSLRPGLDPALAAVVLHALAKEPSARYPTAEAFAAALAALRPSPQRGQRQARGRLPAGLAAGIGAAALVAGVGLGRVTRPAPPPTPTPVAPPTTAPVAPPPTTPAPAPAESVERALERAERLLAAHELAGADDAAAARAIYDALLAADERDAPALLARAVLARDGTATTPRDGPAARRDLERLLALAPGCGPVLAERALLALDEHDSARALELGEAATSAAPRSAAAWRVRATIEAGRSGDRARDMFRTALELDPHDLQAQVGLALLEGARGDLQGAIAGLRRAVTQSPATRRARIELAQALFLAGDVQGAEREAAALRALHPTDSEAHVLGTQVLVRANRYAEAVLLAREAVRLAPASSIALQTLAVAGLADRRPAEALTVLDALRAAGRDDADLRSLRCLALLLAGRRDEAHAAAQAQLRAGETQLTLAVEADRLTASDPGRALALYDRALGSGDSFPGIRLARARLRRARGDAAGAAADLAKVLEQGPTPDALLLRARWAREEGAPGRALDDALLAAGALREDDPVAPEVRAFLLELLAAPRPPTPAGLERLVVAAERAGAGLADEALAALEPVLRRDPADPLARLVKARALLATNELEAAQVELDGLARVASSSAWTRATRAQLLGLRQDPAGARTEAEAALRLDPTLGLAHRLLVEAHLALGQVAEAERAAAATEALGLPEARLLRTRSDVALAKLADALDHSRDVTRPGAGTELASYRVMALVQLGRFDEAQALLDQVWQRVPSLADLLLARGDLRVARGDLEGAAADLDLALRAAPDRPDVAIELITVHQKRRDLPTAQRLIAELTKRIGEPDWLVFCSARILASGGDFAGARRLASDLLKKGRPGFREEVRTFLEQLDRVEREQRR